MKSRKKKYLTYEEAAKLLSPTISESTAKTRLYKLVKEGSVEVFEPCIVIKDDDGSLLDGDGLSLSRSLITRESVEKYINKNEKSLKDYGVKRRRGIKIKAVIEDPETAPLKEGRTFDSYQEITRILDISTFHLRKFVLSGDIWKGIRFVKI